MPAIEPERVAIQGTKGSYSDCAALDFFPKAEIVPCVHYDELFAAVKKGSATCMVIPIENTTAGSIYNYYDLLLEYASAHNFRIWSEKSLLIRHCLVGMQGAKLKGIRTVRSHYAALAQCRNWLKQHHFNPVESFDTAGAPIASLEEAKVASFQSAKDSGAKPLAKNIQDLKNHNYTRFLHIRKALEPGVRKGTAKTSVAFCIKNEPGSLFRTIAVFGSRKDVNVVRIESRNIKGTASHWAKFAKSDWDLVYYLDFTAPASKTSSVLDVLRDVVLEYDGEPALQVFGTYIPGELRDITGKPWR